MLPRTSPPDSPATRPPPAPDATGTTPAAPDLKTPGLWRRMACWLYEGMLMFAVVFVADYLFSALTQTRHGLQNRHGQQAFLFVVIGIYFTWFWSRGQTLAMKTWHIRVVDRHGRPLTQPRALLRYVLSWVWFLPPLAGIWASGVPMSAGQQTVLLIGWIAVWALLARFHPQRQFWHDAWAGTRLVSTEGARR
jgi:uncharacterized RDD family membrane protein YckC